MEHLTTETIEKFTKGEYQYEQLLEISAHLLNCPQVCLERLKQVDPNFLEQADKLENARNKEENQGTHLSDAELEAYVSKEFGLEKRLKMNRHIVKCRFCSSKLKEKDPNYLSSFIKDNLNRENLPEIIAQAEETKYNFKVLIPVATFSILLLVFLATILMLPNNQTNYRAKLEDFPTPNPITNSQSDTEGNKNPANVENSNDKTIETSSNSNKEPKKQNVNLKSDPSSKTIDVPTVQRQPKKVNTDRQQQIIVKDRSLNKNCENNPSLAVTPKDEVITETQPNLTWKPLANASSYKIYVSDAENNLIEESTPSDARKTFYQLNKKLELNKKYEWKIMVTLRDGKEVYSDSAYFSVGEKAKKLSKKKGKLLVNETRCSKN